jgi:hypothetical protein
MIYSSLLKKIKCRSEPLNHFKNFVFRNISLDWSTLLDKLFDIKREVLIKYSDNLKSIWNFFEKKEAN